MPDRSSAEPATARKEKRGKQWIWFYALLAFLTLTAIAVQVWYNLNSQFTAEQMAMARARWNSKVPLDYDMEYTIRQLESTDTYDVKVRRGKAVSVARNGQPLEERLFRYSEMPALFSFVEGFLEQDAEPGKPRTFAIAAFDPLDGHLLHYVRSVMSKRERQEITVTRFDRVTPASG